MNPFFAELRRTVFAPVLEQSEVDGTERTLRAMDDAGWPVPWKAYGLATQFHETGHKMRPIFEYGGKAYFTRMYDRTGARPALAIKNGNTEIGDGARYFGRGDVQITWRGNYRRIGKLIGVDLEDNPDLALDPDISAKIMIGGMQHGWFTGKKLADYDRPNGEFDYLNARRIINGTDKAAMIAGYARQFEAALRKAA